VLQYIKNKGILKWKKILEITNASIVDGDTKRKLIEVFSKENLEESFKQRKNYDEYYFTEKTVSVDFVLLNQLIDYFGEITITSSAIQIKE